jgi:hypothetical protein
MESRNPWRRDDAEEMGNRHRDAGLYGGRRGGVFEQQQQR